MGKETKVTIILENGEKSRFYLHDDELQRLEREVRKQNEYYRENGEQLNYTIGDEICYAIGEYLKRLPRDPEENETPGAATPGESR